MIKIRNRLVFNCVCVLASGILADYAMAATEAGTADADQGTGNGLQKIVVTAQRREQRLQDVPITVTAVSEAAIETQGLTQVESLALVNPSFVPGTQIGYGQPYIRGVGSSIVTPGTESSVALYLNGIYQSRNFALESNLINVDRVEILGGPQGALYGRNATGGVIGIVTKTPQGGLDGEVQQTVGNYGLLETKGYVEGGSSTLEASLSGYTRQHSGYYTNLTYDDKVDKERDYGIAGKLVCHLTDIDVITAEADFGSTNEQPLENESDTYGINARWRHSFDGFDLTTIAGYRDLNAKSSADIDASNIPFIYFAQPIDIARDYSFDIDPSTAAGPFTWLAEVNYFETDSKSNNTVNENTPAVAVFENVTALLTTKAFAVFGQADYAFGNDNKWKVSAGLRYTDEQKSISGATDIYEGVDVPLPLAEVVPGEGSHTWRNVSESASINYAWPQDVNSYSRFTTGFKSGAYNSAEPSPVPLDPEKIKAFEAGTKSDLLDHRLRLNADAFYYDYKDLQVGQINNTGSIIYTNAATAKIYGLESLAAVQPFNDLTLQLSGTWLHTRYTQFPAGAALATYPGALGGIAGNYAPAQLGITVPDLDGFHMENAADFSGLSAPTIPCPQPLARSI